MPTENVLIEHCTVSGYDAGSVDRQGLLHAQAGGHRPRRPDRADQAAAPRARPASTPSPSGNVIFDRSRGFALESVDGAELSGHRADRRDDEERRAARRSSSGSATAAGRRSPARSASELVAPANSVRLDDRGWVLPNVAATSTAATRRCATCRPTTRARRRRSAVPARGSRSSNPAAPTRLESRMRPGRTIRWPPTLWVSGVARVRNISISRVTIEDADPRYPILLAGLVDHPIENVGDHGRLGSISRRAEAGACDRAAPAEPAVRLHRAISAAPATQSMPWLVNTFFAKIEALLPRVGWNAAAPAAGRPIPTTCRRCRASIPSRATSAFCRRTGCTPATSVA